LYKKPVLLTKAHDLSSFDCGNEALNIYIKKYALQNQKKNAGRTFIVTPIESNNIIGYYTLVTGAVSVENAPDQLKKGLGNYPVPIVLIARLAIDKNCQGAGLGKNLLKDAFLRVLQASENIGIRAITVKAKDENAVAFYKRYDFEPLLNSEFDLYILTKNLRALFQ
jgi:GNAT superfamily N-acetyltransferase